MKYNTFEPSNEPSELYTLCLGNKQYPNITYDDLVCLNYLLCGKYHSSANNKLYFSMLSKNAIAFYRAAKLLQSGKKTGRQYARRSTHTSSSSLGVRQQLSALLDNAEQVRSSSKDHTVLFDKLKPIE